MAQQKFGGTGVAITTPFNEQKQVDFDALKTHINYLIDNGINYIVSLGTTGESVTLSSEEKLKIVAYTQQVIDGRIPLVVGVGGNDTIKVTNEINNLPNPHLIDAVLSVSPYYSKPSQQGILAHYQHIADHAKLPIILYNVPGRTGRTMEVETILALAQHKNIIGIKDASGDVLHGIDLLAYKPDNFFVVSGDDALAMAQIACGMTGVISVIANAFPKQFSTFIQHALNFNFNEAQHINKQFLKTYQYLFQENNPAGVKCYLHHAGIIKNDLRLPLVPVSESLSNLIKADLQRISNA